MDYTPTSVFEGSGTGPYMAFSHPVAADFFHPDFAAFLQSIQHPFQMHRKLWEFAYLAHKLNDAGVIKAGKRGLGFGVGQERLPALFARSGCRITATDAPAAIGESWTGSLEYSGHAKDLNFQGLLSENDFLSLVDFQICDMNAIGSGLTGYDFCWSACCLEHLGDLRKGFDFILNSLKTIKPGGVACHTTELNLSSNVETVAEGWTVLYRLRDLQEFVAEVRALGHRIDDIRLAVPATPIDHHVDVPPYSHHNPHLKLALEGFVTTSVGLTIRKADKV